jgi:hypothetical protein
MFVWLLGEGGCGLCLFFSLCCCGESYVHNIFLGFEWLFGFCVLVCFCCLFWLWFVAVSAGLEIFGWRVLCVSMFLNVPCNNCSREENASARSGSR